MGRLLHAACRAARLRFSLGRRSGLANAVGGKETRLLVGFNVMAPRPPEPWLLG
jgi:hypothetical protein